jgi:hypothetical protein
MKLYRGMRAKEFAHFTPEIAASLRATWKEILSDRARGDYTYPDELNAEILEASQLSRLQRQYFTDDKEVALSYAKDQGGILI